MKKLLLIVMMLASMILLSACGSTKSPTISNPNDVYLTVKEGQNIYTVKNLKVFQALKDQVGYTMLMDMIDTDLLKNTKKDGVSFYDQVSQDEINKRLDEDIFPEGKDEYTEEDQTKRKEEYFNSLFSDYGLITEADVFKYYRLLIAKEKYAEEEIRKQVALEDFTEAQYKNYFNNNFKDEYYAIVVSFDSERMLLNALKQLGYTLSKTNIVKGDGTELTNKEVITAFIELYNMLNSSKVENYPINTLYLNEGEEYKVEDGNIVFNLDKIDALHYTFSEITSYESSIQKELAKFSSYDKGENFYTKLPGVYRSGARYSLYMKIGEIKYTLEDKKADIKEELIKQKITSTNINNEILKLRYANNLVIYDEVFASNYASKLSEIELEYKNKKRDSFIFAKTDNNEYSADALFAAMNRNYGISSAISELEFSRFLENLNINKIYNFKTKEVLDATRWTIIQQSIKDEKANFKKDLYKENGYPASMGWENFIKEVYSANDEQELIRFFVFQDVKDQYSIEFGNPKGTLVEGNTWEFYTRFMDKMVTEYFNVTGVHLLITINDNTGTPIDPKDWTTTQVEYAEEFYTQVMDYINNEALTDTPIKKIQNVQNALNRAPYFVAGLAQNSANQPIVEGANYVFNGIEVSKFKSAGLIALYQDLTSFTNGQMVKEFNDAAKSIWNANSNSEETVVYGSTLVEDKYNYLVTKFGYHIYVNTKTTPIPTYGEDLVLPTVEDAVEYLLNSNSSKLSSKLKTAIETYFKPIHKELISSNYLQIVSYKAIKDLEITINHQDYNLNDLLRFLDLTIAKKEASLTYK